MPVTVPTTIFPTEERFVNVVRETTPGTIPASSGTTIPIVQFDPEDKLAKLPDEALRGAMGQTYDVLFGPRYATAAIGGPVYADMIGHELYNILGDYTQTAPSAAPSTTLTAPAAVGATTLTVAAAGSFTVNMWIQVDTGTNSEIVQVLSGVSTTITLQPTTPIRIAHASSVAVTNTTVAAGTYSNIFALLNSGSITGGAPVGFGQPPTHTYTDRTQVPATFFARQYAYSCLSDVTFTGNSEKLTEWNGTLTAFAGQIATTIPTASVSSVRAYPDFNTTVALNGILPGQQIFNIQEWVITMTRKVEPYFTNDGTFNPYVIGRGSLAVTGKLVFSPATDETALLYLLNNTNLQLQIKATNGLTNQSLLGVQFDVTNMYFDTSKINASRSLFGYEVTFECPSNANTVNSVSTLGWSGGYSPIKVTLNNQTPLF